MCSHNSHIRSNNPIKMLLSAPLQIYSIFDFTLAAIFGTVIAMAKEI